MTTHRIIHSAPGTGTIAGLLEASQRAHASYIYWDLSDYDSHALGSLPFLYDGTIERELLTASSVTIVFDRAEHVEFMALNMLIGRLSVWTELNADKPIAVYWPISTLDAERAKELEGDLHPLTLLNRPTDSE